MAIVVLVCQLAFCCMIYNLRFGQDFSPRETLYVCGHCVISCILYYVCFPFRNQPQYQLQQIQAYVYHGTLPFIPFY